MTTAKTRGDLNQRRRSSTSFSAGGLCTVADLVASPAGVPPPESLASISGFHRFSLSIGCLMTSHWTIRPD